MSTSQSKRSQEGSGNDDRDDPKKRRIGPNEEPQIETDEEDEQQNEEEEHDPEDDLLFQMLLRNIGVHLRPARTNEQLVQSLVKRNILQDPKVEKALLTLSRKDFLPRELHNEAFIDSPVRLENLEFNMSAPHMYAIVLQALDIQPGNVVLDIGSGTGHLTCLAALLTGPSGQVYGIDLRKEIIDYSKEKVAEVSKQTGIKFDNVYFSVRNCFIPDIENPDLKFDRIHSGACCPKAKLQDLYNMLKPGGILVTPYGDELIKAVKDEKGDVSVTVLSRVRYSDLIIPSEADVKAALLEIERRKATIIKIPNSSFLSDLGSLINNPKFSDVQLSVEGKTIYVHKAILGKRSKYFDAMFKNGWKESKEKCIVIEDVTYDVFMECLRYIYTDHANVTHENAIELLGAASLFQLDRLKALLEDTIRKLMDTEIAAYVLEAADRHSAHQLYSYTLDFIVQNYNEISKTEAFLNMDKKYIIEITTEACKRASTKKRL